MFRNVSEIDKEIEIIKDRFDEINHKAVECRNELYVLGKELDKLKAEKLKPLVGKFFLRKDGRGIFLVSDVPHPPMTLKPQSPNFYQIPTLYFNIETNELTEETVFSKACDCEGDVIVAFCKDGYEISNYTDFIGTINRIVINKIDKIVAGGRQNG